MRKSTSFDNNPNSDIGASKRVVKEYKKLLAKEQLKPIIQEMNNQTKSVVTNLNDYSLLLKNITQSLVNAELYLRNPEVSKSKGAGRYIGGGNKKEIEIIRIKKEAGKEGITNAKEARELIEKEYRGKPANTKISERHKEYISVFGLANIKNTRNAEKVLGYIDKQGDGKLPSSKSHSSPLDNQDTRLVTKIYGMNTPVSEKSSYAGIDSNRVLQDFHEDNEDMVAMDDLMEGSRFSDNVKSTLRPTGSNYVYLDEEEEMVNADDKNDRDDDNYDEFEYSSLYPQEKDDIEAVTNFSQRLPEEEQEEEDIDDFQDYINRGRGNIQIRENFIITLFSNIINQVHKASDFWETYITPNLSDIPKLKMDSFMKSNTVKNFEDAIIDIRDSLISGTIKTHLDYLNNIYNSLTNVLDELFERMNIDIKRYSGGLSSSSNDTKPKLLGSGYLPFRRSVYSSHLRDSVTKYLM